MKISMLHATGILGLTLLAACFDKDREMAARRPDGTENFSEQSKKSMNKSPSTGSTLATQRHTSDRHSERRHSSSTALAQPEPTKKDGEFKYKPDPKLVKQMKQTQGTK